MVLRPPLPGRPQTVCAYMKRSAVATYWIDLPGRFSSASHAAGIGRHAFFHRGLRGPIEFAHADAERAVRVQFG